MIRATAKGIVGGAMRLMPLGAAVRLARAVPAVSPCLPPGYATMVDDYLGVLRVHIDTRYPIERKMLSGVYEAGTLRAIELLVRPGDVCIDVGANVGAVTLAMALRVGDAGHVHAFEPGPPTFDRLKQNLRLNPALRARVTPVQRGLSDAPGLLHWREAEGHPGNASLRKSGSDRVRVITLDDYAARRRLGRIAFVKIDVEGMEPNVLRGGQKILDRDRPTLHFETLRTFVDRRRDDFRALDDMLRGLGYRLYRLRHGRLVESAFPYDGDNTIAVPQA
jgi:FkbM family methyltransferase